MAIPLSKEVVDPCNGYVRNCCKKCVFFSEWSDHPATHYLCTFNESADGFFKGHCMKWVSATDCEIFPFVKEAHYEPCFAFIDFKLLVSKCRDDIIFQCSL